MQKTLVRAAATSDLDTLMGYSVALALESEGKVLDREVVGRGLRALLADAGKGFMVVAESGGEVVGQTMVTFEWSDWRAGWVWWIQSVYVVGAHRGRGVFRGLLAEIHRRARAEGVVGIRLYVDTGNTAARKAYKRLGFLATDYVVLEKDISHLAE
ncbi:GNAT family N-acetyltransferase [bacterium]|nr:GNAT family N-acetyltransferase [bacterium]